MWLYVIKWKHVKHIIEREKCFPELAEEEEEENEEADAELLKEIDFDNIDQEKLKKIDKEYQQMPVLPNRFFASYKYDTDLEQIAFEKNINFLLVRFK